MDYQQTGGRHTAWDAAAGPLPPPPPPPAFAAPPPFPPAHGPSNGWAPVPYPPVAARTGMSAGLRLLLRVGAAIVVGGGTFFGVHLATSHDAGTAGASGFNDPATLQADIQRQVEARVSNESGPYYLPGVAVTDVQCVLQSGHTFTCVIRLSNGSSESDDAVVSPDGSSYVTK